jgi:tape measure domain-containing protein
VDNRIKFIIGGDASGLESESRRAISSLKNVEGQLTSLKGTAANVLSFVGFGLGVKELITLADQYGQLTARLQLATKFTGNFAEIQSSLRQAADDTRAPLQETVELYTKLSPALQTLGKSGVQSVGVITTINKAIALSGASSEAGAAAMTQFAQALGAGVLRGDELNSILEQAPGLADAIAEGLGVTRGELRKLGEEGKLSSLAVIEALEKVADRVTRDFAELPVTVGQAITLLMNNVTEIVGGTGQATGAMGALARAIVMVSDGLKAFVDSAQPVIIPFFALLIDTVDGAARVFRIAGKTMGALAAEAVAFLKGNFSQVSEIRKAHNEEIDKILNEPLWKDKQQAQIIAKEKDMADQRLKLQKQLVDQVEKLENLKVFAAGKASETILKDDKARTDEQLKNAEKLRSALQSAWATTRSDIESAKKEADSLLAKASQIRQAGKDSAASRRLNGASDEEKSAFAFTEFQSAVDNASLNAAIANSAAIGGRAEAAKKAAEKATKDAERAAKFAAEILDDTLAADAIEQAADVQARALEAQAKLKQQEQAKLQEVSEQQAKTIRDLDAQINDLTSKANSIKVQADITQAETVIAGLRKQLEDLRALANIPVTMQQTGGPQPAPAAPGFWSGGWTGPGGKYQPAGVVHANEFVIRQESVRQRGAMQFLQRFNQFGMGALKGYANGGLVSRLPVQSLPSGSSSGPVHRGVFDLGALGRYPVSASADVFDQLTDRISREALRKGGRR